MITKKYLKNLKELKPYSLVGKIEEVIIEGENMTQDNTKKEFFEKWSKIQLMVECARLNQVLVDTIKILEKAQDEVEPDEFDADTYNPGDDYRNNIK